MVLLQYAVNDGPIELYNVWEQPIGETLNLIEWMMDYIHVGFNLTFDHFHLQKIYSVFDYAVRYGGVKTNQRPMDVINKIAVCEDPAREKCQCLKPKGSLDLMLEARKGKYQSLMQRSAIRVRKIPKEIAWDLRDELEKRVELDDIYFARRKDKTAPQWSVYDIKDNPDFKDVVLNFNASGALKALAVYALKANPEEVYEFGDVKLPDKAYPKEAGWAPFAGALGGTPEDWKGEWPEKILEHISHWYWNRLARQYAEDDVKYTRQLYHHLDCPEPNDDDSILATLVGSVRWRGFALNLDAIREQRSDALVRQARVPTSPAAARKYIEQVMNDDEKLILEGSTKKILLEEIATWTLDGDVDFEISNWTPDDLDQNTPVTVLEDAEDPTLELMDVAPDLPPRPHPAAIRAREVLEAREAAWEVNLFNKLLQAKRFHASFNVIGTLSSRMSGTDGLNPQGIKNIDRIRECFTLADPGFNLGGGDFDAFEVALAEAVYNDENLRRELQSGKKIHGLFATKLWPHLTYEEVLKTKGTPDDKYTKGKQGVFAMIYGGDPGTLHNKLGVPMELAEQAYQDFATDYPGVGIARKRTFDKFCSMRQPGGIGTKVIWNEPADYVESLFGFRRYFTLENRICKVLFELAQRPPRRWREVKIKVMRRDRVQTVSGAAQSALYAAAFGIQASNMRAAANHEIQSSGAQKTKELQVNIWSLQPVGINEWVVQPMNIHDEVMAPHRPEVGDALKAKVSETVTKLKETVPLTDMEWANDLETWAGK